MDYDIVIIGFGKAGKTLALKSAAQGKKVVLVEKSLKMYGGTCINVGCIPSKRLIELSKSAKFHSDKKAYFKDSMDKKEALITALRAKNYDMLNTHPNIDVIDGFASFVDKNSIKVTKDENVTQINAKTIVINTGSVSKSPDFLINSNRVCFSEDILSLDTLPDRLVVVGSGFIGLEIAFMFANFGSKVSVLVRKDEFLPSEDRDVSELVLSNLKSLGVDVLLGVTPKSIDDNVITCVGAGGKEINIEADKFLIATGRLANTSGLNLDKAGVELDRDGNIAVDKNLKTSTNNIYAVGDVKGGELFTYISLDDFRIVYDDMFANGTRNTENRSFHASVAFLDNPLAKIGLSQNEAMQNPNAKVLKLPLSAVPKAKIINSENGFLKAFVDGSTKEILGAVFYCKNADELINEIALVMGLGGNANVFKSQIFTHPSLSEALNDLFANA